MAYPIGVTKGLETWKTNSNHVERPLDNASFDAAHPDDTLLYVGPARKGVVQPGRTGPRSMMAFGICNTISLQSSAPVMPMMAIGSARSFMLRGKSQTNFSLQRAMLSGRNMLRALYHNAVETPGLDASQFDDPAALSRNSSFFINLDSELFYIPFGLGITIRTKGKSYVAGIYMELGMLNSYSLSIQSGQSMIGEGCTGLCDRLLPFQASDAIGSIATNGRQVMDSVLGMAANVFPPASASTIAAFNDDGLDNGTVDSI
jgi:hypothetical protein